MKTDRGANPLICAKAWSAAAVRLTAIVLAAPFPPDGAVALAGAPAALLICGASADGDGDTTGDFVGSLTGRAAEMERVGFFCAVAGGLAGGTGPGTGAEVVTFAGVATGASTCQRNVTIVPAAITNVAAIAV